MRFLRLHINRCTCQKIYTRGDYGAIFGAPFLRHFYDLCAFFNFGTNDRTQMYESMFQCEICSGNRLKCLFL